MLELAGPMAVVALTLAVGGAFKLRDPSPTASMLQALGLTSGGRGGGRGSPARSGRALARVVGAVELAVGVWAALAGGVAAYLLAGVFALFAVVMARLVALGPAASSCGCFGSLSTRPTALHVVADGVAAAVALCAALLGAPGIVGALGELGGPLGVVFVAFVAMGTWALVAVVTVLPEALDAARRDGPEPPTTFHLVPAPVRDRRGTRPPGGRGVGGPA